MRIELLHPIMVHFAIGLLATGAMLAVAGGLFRRSSVLAAGQWALWIGACFGVAAVTTGLMAEDRMPSSGPIHDLFEIHETLAFITLGVFAATSVGWLGVVGAGWNRLRLWLYVLGVIGVVLILVTGYYGGEMVFNHGAGVEVNGRPVWNVGPG